MWGTLLQIGMGLAGMNATKEGLDNIGVDFNYNPHTSQMSGLSNKLQGYGDQMFDPNSDFYSNQRSRLSEVIGQGVAQDTLAQNRMLASRGIGSGGIRTMLDMVNSSGIGEQARQGHHQMYQQGLGIGTNMFGQAGQLESQIGQMKDAQKQYALTSEYNQRLQNRQNKAGFANQMIGGAMNMFSLL